MGVEKKLTDQKREDIIVAATEEFKTHGFRATSMDQIATTAQVSKRTVYNHFENKVVLFQAITRELFDKATQVSEHPYDPNVPVKEQLRAIAEQEMAMLTSEDFLALARVITSESLSSPELTKVNFDEFQESGIGVVKWIGQAAKDGKLRISDPVYAGRQFLSLIEGAAFWPQLFSYKPIPTEAEQREIIDSSIDMFLKTYST
ncbi:MAG: TetR/AcrR family transcriptional regulator [Arenicellales bacterium]|nr:TetR/AcrR family transcriptional regulator [Arenicellales bacterium]